MLGYVNKNAQGNEGNNVGTRQVPGPDGNGKGAWPVAEFGMKNEETWLIKAFEDNCCINHEIGNDNSDEAMTGMEEPSLNAENEGSANNEKERVIFHWDDTRRKYVEGFRPGHKMIRWDAEKWAYVFCYNAEPPSNPDQPPVFHYDKKLRSFVEGMDLMETMWYWDADIGGFTHRLTQRIIDAFNRDKALNRNV